MLSSTGPIGATPGRRVSTKETPASSAGGCHILPAVGRRLQGWIMRYLLEAGTVYHPCARRRAVRDHGRIGTPVRLAVHASR